jgi:hypothetical protein
MASSNNNPMSADQVAAARAANDALAREFTLTPTTRATVVLFNFEGRADGTPRRENDAVMTGSADFDVLVGNEVQSVQVPVSAFLKEAATTNRKYLSLSMGVAGGTHYNGKLFNNKDAADRKPDSPEYSGFITVLPVFTNADGSTTRYSEAEWDDAPVVQLYGKAVWAAGKDLAYIKLDLVPRRNNAPVPDSALKF